MPNNLSLQLNLKPEIDIRAINLFLSKLKKSLGKLGANVDIIDESKFKSELKKIGSDYDEFGNKLQTKSKEQGKDAGKAFGKSYSKSIKSTVQKETSGGLISKGTLDVFKGNILSKSVSGAANAIKGAFTAFTDLDKEVKNIGTLGREGFEDFSAGALKLAKDIPDSAATVANGVYNAISAGITGTTQDILNFVETASQVAVAGQSDTNTAVKGLAAVINAYGLQVSDTEKISSTFFAAIKYGVTTFEELNAALPQVVPTAAQMGLEFVQVESALASITQQGTPTAIAATQIGGALVLLNKGTPDLIKGLKAVGSSLPELQQQLKAPVKEGGGLVNVLKKIKDASDKTGISLFKMTGRKEAANAINQLAGNTRLYTKSLQTLDGVQKEVAEGAAGKAFDVAAEGIGIKLGGLANTIEGVFIQMFQSMSPMIHGVVELLTKTFSSGAIISVLEGLGQVITGVFDGIKTVIETIGEGVSVMLTPLQGLGVEGDNIARIFKIITTTLLAGLIAWKTYTLGMLAYHTALKLTAGGTNILVGALKAMKLALATNPFGILLAGVTAAVALYAVFQKSSKELAEEQLKSAEASKENLRVQQKDLEAQENRILSTQDLIGEYARLGNQTDKTTEQTKRFKEVEKELNALMPQAVELGGDYSQNMENIADKTGIAVGNTDKLGVANRNLVNEYNSLSRTTADSIKNQDRLKEIYSEITNEELVPLIDGTFDFNGGLKTLAETTGHTAMELGDVRDRLSEVAKGMETANKLIMDARINMAVADITTEIDQLSNGLDLMEDKLEKDLQGDIRIAVKAAGETETSGGVDEAFKVITDRINTNVEAMKAKYGELKVGKEADYNVLINLIGYIDKYKAAIKSTKKDVLAAKNAMEAKTEADKKAEAQTKADEKAERAKSSVAKKTASDNQKKLSLALKQIQLDKDARNLLINTNALGGDEIAKNKEKLDIQKSNIEAAEENIKAFEGIYKVAKILNEDTGMWELNPELTKEKSEGLQQRYSTMIGKLNKENFNLDKLETDVNIKTNIVDKDAIDFGKLFSQEKTKIEQNIRLGYEDQNGKPFTAETMVRFLEQTVKESKDAIKAINEELASNIMKLDGDVDPDTKSKLELENEKLREDLNVRKEIYIEADDELNEHKAEQAEKNREWYELSSEQQKQFSQNTISAVTETGKALITGEQGFAKALVSLGWDTIDAMIPVWSAQMLGLSLSGPESVLTGGTAGIIKWTLLTGILKGLLAGLRAASGFKSGGWTGDEPTNQVTGQVHGQEYVVSAPYAKKYLPMLKAMNTGKLDSKRNNRTSMALSEIDNIRPLLDRLNIKSYADGSGFINKPELAMVGDSQFNPELVMNSKDLISMIKVITTTSNAEIISAINYQTSVIANLELSLAPSDVARSTNRYNNKMKSQFSQVLA